MSDVPDGRRERRDVAPPPGSGVALVAVGANLGDPIRTCVDLLAVLGSWGRIVATSYLYRTSPVGGPPGQPDYVNGVVAVEPPATRRAPAQVLSDLHAIEVEFGRTRTVRWEARTLDLDLLDLGGTHVVASPTLTLPHPRMMERPFVLIPLRDVVPGWVHPATGVTIDVALRSLDAASVERLHVHGWPG